MIAWPPHYDGATLNPICISFNLLLLLRNRKIIHPFPFTSCRIGGVSFPGSIIHLIQLPIRPLFISFSNLKFPGALFLPDLYILYFAFLCLFFSSAYLHKNTNNHKTEPILGCLDISSTRKINPLFFNFVSGEF